MVFQVIVFHEAIVRDSSNFVIAIGLLAKALLLIYMTRDLSRIGLRSMVLAHLVAGISLLFGGGIMILEVFEIGSAPRGWWRPVLAAHTASIALAIYSFNRRFVMPAALAVERINQEVSDRCHSEE